MIRPPVLSKNNRLVLRNNNRIKIGKNKKTDGKCGIPERKLKILIVTVSTSRTDETDVSGENLRQEFAKNSHSVERIVCLTPFRPHR